MKLETMVAGDGGPKMFALTIVAQIHEGKGTHVDRLLREADAIIRWLNDEGGIRGRRP